jgi:hypothetical protein
MGLLHEFDGQVGKLDHILDCGFGGVGGNVVDQEFGPAAVGISGGGFVGWYCIEDYRHMWCICRCWC